MVKFATLIAFGLSFVFGIVDANAFQFRSFAAPRQVYVPQHFVQPRTYVPQQRYVQPRVYQQRIYSPRQLYMQPRGYQRGTLVPQRHFQNSAINRAVLAGIPVRHLGFNPVGRHSSGDIRRPIVAQRLISMRRFAGNPRRMSEILSVAAVGIFLHDWTNTVVVSDDDGTPVDLEYLLSSTGAFADGSTPISPAGSPWAALSLSSDGAASWLSNQPNGEVTRLIVENRCKNISREPWNCKALEVNGSAWITAFHCIRTADDGTRLFWTGALGTGVTAKQAIAHAYMYILKMGLGLDPHNDCVLMAIVSGNGAESRQQLVTDSGHE